ncbi:TonB-dependent receptor [Kineobactrum salinum]|uniref:TonB-dependent receptor n=1 Tax=Kineobactrum salinum TaxID=2708301 RepID=A0A6C0TYM5_9GAMM|nr:TonB-dependent receptor [Kineobactrum salinum]QIB64901.1 TonB-dependent receptor [Kineobactrum salinum]
MKTNKLCSGTVGTVWIPRNILLCASVSATLLTLSTGAQRLNAAEALGNSEDRQGIEEIIVTARKRTENLLDIPVAVSVLSEGKIAATGVRDITEISDFTPGLTSQGQGAGGLPDRSANRLVFRGLSTSFGSVFINGAPYTADNSPDVTDLERVEVLTGPQSVYFGRATFSGALNFVTKPPSDEFQARLSADVGTDDYNEFRGVVEGPVLDENLSVRLSVRHYDFGGQYRSAVNGIDLGEQRTDNVTVALASSPGDNLDMSLFYAFSREEDSHPATAKLQTFGTTPLLDCDLGGTNAYYCGRLPDYSDIGSAQIGDNIVVTDLIRDVFVNNSLDLSGFDLGPSLDHFGLKRDIHHVNGRIDFETDAGWQLTTLASYTQTSLTNLRALIGRDTSDVPNIFRSPDPATAAQQPDFIQLAGLAKRETNDLFGEFRISSPQDNRLRATAGASYFKVYGPATVGMLMTNIGPLPSTFDGGTDSGVETSAVFGGIYFDTTEDLTISAEARYQWDSISQKTVFPVPGPQLEKTFKSFSPRLTADYQVAPEHLLYATFSRGYKPGGFNSVLPTLDPELAAQVPPGFDSFFDEEQLDNYEVGHKGNWLDYKLRTTLALYHMQLTDGQVSEAVFLPGPPATPMTLVSNVGKVDLRGAELNADLFVNDHLTISGTLDYNDNEIKQSVFSDGLFIQGSTDVSGNMLDHVSKVRLSLSPVFSFAGPGGGTVQLRFDWLYRSKWYIDNSNSAYVPARHLVNSRLTYDLGDKYSFELYVKNLFDDDTLAEALRAPETLYSETPPMLTPVITPTQNTIFTGLPEQRRFGIKFSVRF